MIEITEIVQVVNVDVDEINNSIVLNVTEQNNIANVVVSDIGLQGPKGDFENLIKVSAESIPSYTPVAIYNNLAYKLDASNPLHQFAFVGFSINGTSTGQNCEIKQLGELTLYGWGLTPNQQYLAGINGTLITENLSSSNFTKVIGYAVTSDKLEIIKDSITINKI
jgi:hypothetical protein